MNAARDAVAKLRSDWVAAANRDDAAAVGQTYAEDATLMTAEGVVRGRQAIQDVFTKAFAMSSGLEVMPMSFDASGDLAYDAGRYSQEVKTPDGKLIKDAGHYVVVLKRQSDGAWLIAQHISTPDGSPGV